jgi:hypothetical protein
MQSAKSESEELLNAVLPFAEELLAKHGEFFPFGAAMNHLGGISHIAGYTGSEQPPSSDVIDLLRTAFHSAGHSGEYRATALAYDVQVQVPGTEAKSDAVAIELDHRDSYSVVVYFPYTLSGGVVEVGSPFAQAGSNEIFGSMQRRGDA